MEKAVKLSKSEFVRNYMALQSHRGQPRPREPKTKAAV